MPLPFDLASVAWLAILRTAKPSRIEWYDRYHWLAVRKSLGADGSRVLDDAYRILSDQLTYIRSLEEQLRPHLVHETDQDLQESLL